MNQSNQTTYKNTLYASTALFVFLMCAATSSLSLGHSVKAEVTPPTSASEIAQLGRFIVTPTSTRFVSTSVTSQTELAPRAKIQGAL